MKIALDYDETYNKDTSFWEEVIATAKLYGHEVMIVTARCPKQDRIDDRVEAGIPIYYANGIAKKWYMHHHENIDIDVWIDDKPDNIINNSQATKEVLREWRASEAYVK